MDTNFDENYDEEVVSIGFDIVKEKLVHPVEKGCGLVSLGKWIST